MVIHFFVNFDIFKGCILLTFGSMPRRTKADSSPVVSGSLKGAGVNWGRLVKHPLLRLLQAAATSYNLAPRRETLGTRLAWRQRGRPRRHEDENVTKNATSICAKWLPSPPSPDGPQLQLCCSVSGSSLVLQSAGIWSRECERSSRISSGRLLCMDYLIQLFILGDCSLKHEGKPHRSADPAGVVLFLLSSPRHHVIQPNHAGMLAVIVLNVIFCPRKMDKVLVNSLQVRNCLRVVCAQDLKFVWTFFCARHVFERILS